MIHSPLLLSCSHSIFTESYGYDAIIHTFMHPTFSFFLKLKTMVLCLFFRDHLDLKVTQGNEELRWAKLASFWQIVTPEIILFTNTGRPRRQLIQRFAWRLCQVEKPSLPDEA